jgi:phage terminase small subunit
MLKTETLTAKEQAFCEEYLVDLSKTAAYLRAGYKPGRSNDDTSTRAARVYRKPQVLSEIEARMAERSKQTGITAERVVRELAKVAFASMRSFITIDSDGQPQINLTRTPDDELDALVEVTIETVLERQGSGDEATVATIRKSRIKLHDKLRALHALAKHTGVYDKNRQVQVSFPADAFRDLFVTGSRAPLRKGGPKR